MMFLNRLITAFLLVLVCTSAGCSSSSKSGTEPGDGTITDTDLTLDSANRYGEGTIPQASARESGLFADVHFDFDSSAIKPEYRDQLREDAKVLNQDESIQVEIEGHCDKRGTAEYNMALGEERAKAVAGLLTSFGVSRSRLRTISYGAEIPLDPRSTEDAYAKNRRAHFALTRPENGGAGARQRY